MISSSDVAVNNSNKNSINGAPDTPPSSQPSSPPPPSSSSTTTTTATTTKRQRHFNADVIFDGSYDWSQTSDVVSVSFSLPSSCTTSGRGAVRVSIRNNSIMFGLRRIVGETDKDMDERLNVETQRRRLMDHRIEPPEFKVADVVTGELFANVSIDPLESMWTMEQVQERKHKITRVTIHLAKVETGLEWPHVFCGDAEVSLHRSLAAQHKYKESMVPLNAAVERGCAAAELRLGQLHQIAVVSDGKSPFPLNGDYRVALRLYRLAAYHHNGEAAFLIARAYNSGASEGSSKVPMTCVFGWYALSGISCGDHTHRAAALCSAGNLETQDLKTGKIEDATYAVQWWVKAAHYGSALAAYNLGVLYSKGQGVKQDLPLSMSYFALSQVLEPDNATYKAVPAMTSPDLAREASADAPMPSFSARKESQSPTNRGPQVVSEGKKLRRKRKRQLRRLAKKGDKTADDEWEDVSNDGEDIAHGGMFRRVGAVTFVACALVGAYALRRRFLSS